MQNGTVTVGRVGYPGHQCVEVLHHAVLRKQTVELDTANQYDRSGRCMDHISNNRQTHKEVSMSRGSAPRVCPLDTSDRGILCECGNREKKNSFPTFPHYGDDIQRWTV